MELYLGIQWSFMKTLPHGPDGNKYLCTKKIYRLKEDQAFSLSLELGRREKVARHRHRLQISSFTP